MRSLTAVVLSLFAATSFAAISCDTQAGSTNCVSKGFALQVSRDFCREHLDEANSRGGADVIRPYGEGNGAIVVLDVISLDGDFSEPACRKASEDIINECFGSADGGVSRDDSALLSIGFCNYGIDPN